MKCIITYKNDLKGEPKNGYILRCDDFELSESNKNLIKFSNKNENEIFIPVLIVNFDAVESIEIQYEI